MDCVSRRWTTIASVAAFVLYASTAYSAVPRPNIVPQPKTVEGVHGAWEVGPGSFLLCDRRDPMLESGIEEIQKRLAAIEAPALLRTKPAGAVAGTSAIRVVLGLAEDASVRQIARQMGVSLDPAQLGPQGYLIRFATVDAVPTALLAGGDLAGTLYACVTFAQMLRRDGNRIVADAADVTDRPDFQWRIIGRPAAPSARLCKAPSPEAARKEYDSYVRSMRENIDFCLQFKINGITLRSSGTGKWSNVAAFGPAARAALREVSDYARDRGVFLEATAYSAIDVGQGGPAAELTDIVRTHGVGYCWSRDEMLRERAREFGRFAREAGIGLYYLHAPDRTSLDDPGLFSKRCSLCQKRWKDDERAKADAHVMNIMYEEIKRASPTTRICAVLVPYGATLDRLEPAKRDEILRYWREASALLPADMAICVRENRRPNVAAFKEAFARQPVYFYIESIYWRGWEPMFSTTPRHARTFDFDDPRDLYYMGNSGDFGPLCHAVAAQFAWNSQSPGAALQRTFNHHPLQDGIEPPEVAKELVDQLAARLFGEENSPLIGDAVRGDLSWAYTSDPEATSRAAIERLEGRDSDIPGQQAIDAPALRDLPALMRHQQQGSAAGLSALRQLAKRINSGDWKPNDWQRRQFDFLASYVGSVNALSSVRYPLLAGTQAMERRDHRAARQFAQAGLEAVPVALKALDEVSGWLESEDAWYARARGVRNLVAADQQKLQQLLKLAEGIVPELADSPENLKTAAFLLRGRSVKTQSSGNGSLEFTDQVVRTPGQKTLHFTRPQQPWAGCSVRFDPVDVRRYEGQGGYLRFYVNSDGPKGWQRATFWGIFQDAEGKPVQGQYVYLHKPSDEERNRKPWPGFVDVDDLEDTWQLVSIPLAQFAAKDAVYLTGLHLNFAKVPDCGLVIADPYLIGNTEPVRTERAVRRDPQTSNGGL